MYRSADGKRVAGTFCESESATMTYPCDEFTYVKKGWVKAEIQGGDTFIFYTVVFCFPLEIPTTPISMNYVLVIVVAAVFFICFLWFGGGKSRTFVGPTIHLDVLEGLNSAIVNHEPVSVVMEDPDKMTVRD
jgi:hypothetical protein